MRVVDPDPQWYLDHVLVARDPESSGKPGPARSHYSRWLATQTRIRQDAQANGSRAVIAATELALRQGFVLTHAQVRACGVDDPLLRRLARRGAWTTPRHGVLSVLSRQELAVDGTEIATAAAVLAHPGAVVSHGSAVSLSGLPQLATPRRPILTRRHRSMAGGRGDVLLHACKCTDQEIEYWFGVPVTRVARTVIDESRASGTGAGLVVADAALHEHLVTRPQLEAALLAGAGRPGLSDARRVVRLADGRAESPLESLTRQCLIEGNLPGCEPQQWIATDRGRFRVDLLYKARRVVVEADGKIKYREQDDALWNEKLRQEALERAGFRVVRVNWDEVTRHPAQVLARVRSALGRSAAGGR